MLLHTAVHFNIPKVECCCCFYVFCCIPARFKSTTTTYQEFTRIFKLDFKSCNVSFPYTRCNQQQTLTWFTCSVYTTPSYYALQLSRVVLQCAIICIYMELFITPPELPHPSNVALLRNFKLELAFCYMHITTCLNMNYKHRLFIFMAHKNIKTGYYCGVQRCTKWQEKNGIPSITC